MKVLPIQISVLTIAAIIALTGCGKEAPVHQDTAPELVDAAQYVPGVVPGTMIQTKVTAAMHAFYEANNRWPKDFSELVTAKLLKQVPTPPAGQKFLFDSKSRQVLVVPE
jgi:hypothetical protein